MGKSIEQLRDEYIAKKLEGVDLPYGMEYLNLLSKFIEEAEELYPMPNEQTKKTQTSVEWLIAELGEYFPHEIGGIELMVEKAKKKHREQMISFTYAYLRDCFIHKESREIVPLEQYYNEIFDQ